MTDIGDAVTVTTTITDTDGEPVDPASVTIAVTDPAGTETSPTVTPNGVGLYESTFTVDQAGQWLYKWTTASPDGVEWGSLTVRDDPPNRALPLATLEDLEDLLGRSLTDTEKARAPGLLRSASAKVRAACNGQQFTRANDDQVVLGAQGTTITLPQRPVIDVTAVAALGREGAADIALTGWSWDGITSIDLTGAADTNVSADGTWWAGIERHVNRYRVTYSHGYDVVPDLLVTITAQAVLRVLSTGAPEGMTQRTIGQYSEQFQQATGAPGSSTWLTRTEKGELAAAGFRRRAHSVGLRRR